ncbi:MAG: hypothetical protein [Cressdnaviricota sp.]|nr:MAG: hypothetical protein [Cressdnaviricota sp.]
MHKCLRMMAPERGGYCSRFALKPPLMLPLVYRFKICFINLSVLSTVVDNKVSFKKILLNLVLQNEILQGETTFFLNGMKAWIFTVFDENGQFDHFYRVYPYVLKVVFLLYYVL